jgi:hypothetical protein
VVDEQDRAEYLDDSELGAGESLLAAEPPFAYPPDELLGADEPQAFDDAIEDSVAERAAREEPDTDEGGLGDGGIDAGALLVDDDDGDAFTAAFGEAEPSADEPSAEEAAMRVEPDTA